MHSTGRNDRFPHAALIACLLAAFVFVADIFIPLGVAGGVPYVAVILIALNVPSSRFVLMMGCVCSILTITDVFVSVGPGTTEWWKVIVNRCLALAAIWVTVLLGLQRNRAQETYRLQLQELARLSRIQTVEHLAAALAHELNQPLTAISLQAEVAKQSPALASHNTLQTALGEIAEQSQRASAIIRTLRGMIQKSESIRCRVSINDLVRAAVKLIEPAARHQHVELRIDLAQHLPDVLADPIQIEQVILNLLQNGVDALGQGNIDQRIITVVTQPENAGRVRLTISDSGPGIPPEQQSRLFEPFVTTKTHGIGLGLSLSRSLVEAHGGTLTYESHDATTFTVLLPIAGMV